MRQAYSPIRDDHSTVRLLRGEPKAVGKLHFFQSNHHMKHYSMSVPGPAILPTFPGSRDFAQSSS